jgi:hypothetical protein
MADAVTTQTIFNTPQRIKVHWTNISDSAGENGVKKLDITTLRANDGLQPNSLDIEEVSWSIQGFTSVRILWSHTTPDVALVLSPGSGYMDFRNNSDPLDDDGIRALNDPRSVGGDGSILVTTISTGGAFGVLLATYDILITFRKRPG